MTPPGKDGAAGSRTLLYGVVAEARAAAVLAGFRSRPGGGRIVLLPAAREIEPFAADLERMLGWAGDDTTRVFPFPEAPGPDLDNRRRNDQLGARMELLADLITPEPASGIVVTTPEALFGPCPARTDMEAGRIELAAGATVPFAELVESLATRLDYDAEAVCEYPGQFAVRGGLVDVYPFDAARPYRIDFFGDEIESIRAYDPASQRSIGTVERITLNTATPPDGAEGGFHAYLPDGPVDWLLVDPAGLVHAHPLRFTGRASSRGTPRAFEQLLARRDGTDQVTGIAEIDTAPALFEGAPRTDCRTEPVAAYRAHPDSAEVGMDRFESEQSARSRFERQLAAWAREGYALHFAAAGEAEEARIRELLAENPDTAGLKPVFHRGAPAGGFLVHPESPLHAPAFPAGAVALVTDDEYFGRRQRRVAAGRKRLRPETSQVDQLLDFAELADGDPLVHLQHGVCLFRGLTRLEVAGGEREVISLEFAADMTLHVPLHESHLLTRYVGLSKQPPKLGKVGGSGWQKTRAAAEKATLDFAAELLRLHARREQAGGHAFAPDHPWQRGFESAFPHRETRDQQAAIDAAKTDMEAPLPMDRLVCGDVGFGKTEVALRAVFKAVMDGRQVAVLVPTTVLCQQHFNTFRERMAEYPLVIEMVSRFRSAAQNREILADLAAGRVDVVIGTHRLLSRDVVFSKLGLLVIDEEQRFGVRHKEQIKRLRANVDILTLSATPIPRTLYLALSGAREMSLIETPPVDRLPIQTVVRPYDPDLVRRAIQSETGRGGQVFYLHNRVDSIHRVAAGLEELLPGLRVAVGHGQMKEHQLERVMTRFVAGDYDVLVCTTIIESGLDIPNCNTLIIEGADRFGLAQLYQIRGRVGRFKRQAYAYLLLHRHGRLIEQAHKRLTALRHHNQLGAGFRIAMRDLELRGAGNLLGPQQSGHIAGVGFELYCQLLRQSVARLKGEPGADRIRAEVQLDFVAAGEGAGARRSISGSAGFAALKDAEYDGRQAAVINACLPPGYVGEARLRIDLYRRLALADSVDEVRTLADELRDRFGEPPPEVEALVAASEIRVLAERAGVNRVSSEGDRLICRLARPDEDGEFLKRGNRFPRLTAKQPLRRLAEIASFLQGRKDEKGI